MPEQRPFKVNDVVRWSGDDSTYLVASVDGDEVTIRRVMTTTRTVLARGLERVTAVVEAPTGEGK